jgi:hypothetical protein
MNNLTKLLKVIWFLLPLSIVDFILQAVEMVGDVAAEARIKLHRFVFFLIKVFE